MSLKKILFFLFISSIGNSKLPEESIVNSRLRAMGGAYVGLADDSLSLYLNPAGLSSIEKFTLKYFTFYSEIASELAQSYAAFQATSNGSIFSQLNGFMGQRPFFRLSSSPTLVMPNFALGFIFDGQYGLTAENQTLPNFQLINQTTNGIQAGFSYSFTNGGRKRKRAKKFDLSAGAAGKILFRRGGRYTLSTTTLFQLTRGTELLTSTVGFYKLGIGLDLGILMTQHLSPFLKYKFGVAYQNIGDTAFSEPAQPEKGRLSLGGSLIYTKPFLKTTLSYDYRNLLQEEDFRLKNHLGLELKFPFLISLYGGINQVYLTYGFGIDVWAVQVKALSFAEETGVIARQEVSRRYVLEADFVLQF